MLDCGALSGMRDFERVEAIRMLGMLKYRLF